MVSFSCEVCNDTVLKKKLQQHQRSCRGSYFTCIDCSTTFYNNDHVKHTSCITEAEKYEKGLYKGKNGKGKQQQPYKKIEKAEEPKQETKKEEPKKEIKKEEPKKDSKKNQKQDPTGLSKYIDSTTDLYKVFKSIKKDNSKISDKTDFLKSLKVTKNEDGSITLNL